MYAFKKYFIYCFMRLTHFTDYTLRALMYLGAHRDRLVTIQDIADTHQVSKNNMTKVVHQLGLAGLVETVRGRNGGLRLKLDPGEISVGAIVRSTETDFHMAECFDPHGMLCPLAASCRLQHVLTLATSAYLAVLDGQTLATLLEPGRHPVEAPVILQRAAGSPPA